MDGKERKKILTVFAGILIVGLLADIFSGGMNADGVIERGDVGADEKELELTYRLNGEDTEYDYRLEVAPMQISESMAQEYFTQAIAEIDKALEEYRQNPKQYERIPLETEYCDGVVEAEWWSEPSGLVTQDGEIVLGELPEAGCTIRLRAKLFCGAYEQSCEQEVEVAWPELSTEEAFLHQMDVWAESEMKREGESSLQLPKELGGVSVEWTQKKERLMPKLLFLEGAALIAICLGQKKKKEQDERARKLLLELDYPDLLSQITLLLGAGMPLRQVWKRIAAGYTKKREDGQIQEKPVYEEILLMVHRMSEGESEKSAYVHFSEKMNLMCYHRLIRILIGNLEKGAKGVCELLEQELQQAYEQRLLQAKKLGEEASTKMLLPLMLMLMVVMAVVMLPAMIRFAA